MLRKVVPIPETEDMKRYMMWVAALGLGVITSGCLLISVSKQPTQTAVIYLPTTSPVAGGTAPELEMRMQAASQISDLTQRDQATAKIAVDAAGCGQPVAVHQALGKMSDNTMRDKTAGTCAITLAARGMRQEALDVAKNISDLALRDQTLAKLAGN